MNVLGATSRKLARRLEARRVPDLAASQWWSLERHRAFQLARLRRIVVYAYAHVPAYRAKFDAAGVSPRDLRRLEDLARFPETTREELQNDPSFVVRPEVHATLHTGGSTGATLEYYESLHASTLRQAVHRRGWAWSGVRPGDRRAVVGSAQGVVRDGDTLNLPGDFTGDRLRETLEALRAFEPAHLRGYVGSLFLLARYLRDHAEAIPGLRSVNVISENLYPYQREEMEKAFAAPVFEEYVCNDGGASAWECEAHTGLHAALERSVIEAVDGEMLTTDLWNRAMPFIRYRNGDAVEFVGEACPCGRALPLLRVRGRDNDFLVSREGVVSPSFLVHHGAGLVGPDRADADFKSGIRTVQYVQDPGYRLTVNVVCNDWCTPEELVDFERRITPLLPGLALTLNVVDDVPATAKGKRGFIVNRDAALLRRVGVRP